MPGILNGVHIYGPGILPSRSFSRSHPHPQDSSPPQQPPSPQVSSPLPVRADRIRAAAHPTPLCTSIAPGGQFRAQAPHSMQRSGAPSTALSVPSRKTPCGQTSVQRRQLIHRSGKNTRVLFRYESNILTTSLPVAAPREQLRGYTLPRTGRPVPEHNGISRSGPLSAR